MKKFFIMVGQRISKLVAGLISLKFMIWLVATIMLAEGFDSMLWFLISIFLVSTRCFEKIVKAGWWNNNG